MVKSSKKSSVEATPAAVNGEGGLVVAVNGAAAAAVEVTVRIVKAKLDCPICSSPLKPPVYECAVGHLACGACYLQLADSSDVGPCSVCGNGVTYARSTAMEDTLRSAKVLCPYNANGCRAYVTYYDAAEHQLACPHAPCL